MTLTIPDEIVEQTGHDERELLIDLACALYDQEKLSIKQARLLCGLERGPFEEALKYRKLPVYRYTLEMLNQDMEWVTSQRKQD